ncbi:helix-turn-helix domain-containing protein [Sphingorhabdus pulchriflava]|uniref:helix-turn-helix domain-containing protein n=1 Tax=Sphingorhabdus pulchriflava TaxID=2292257 RepID=UPI0011C04483|nr:helix-turn-helix domain-containing protein [Sphingorhabdus pulchriflava]
MSDERLDDGTPPGAPENAEFRFQTVGEQLKAAREAQGLSLTEVASRTRVPMRHLDAIERSEFSALPGTTYTVGFARSYAKVMELDDVKLANDLREELAQGGYQGTTARMPAYEPADPARVPPRWLAWSAAALALAVLIAYFVWRSFALSSDAPSPEATKVIAEAEIGKQNAASSPASNTEAIDPKGEVVISATETVWLKIYDKDNKRLYEKEMQPGERYIVPADAQNPMIVTGRPQVLNVTIGGKPVPPLGSGDKSIADLEVSAAALLARKPVPPAETTSANVSETGGAASVR